MTSEQYKIIGITQAGEISRNFSELLLTNMFKLITLKTSEIVPVEYNIINDILKLSFGNNDYFIFLSINAVKIFIDFAKKSTRFTDILYILNNRVKVVAIGVSTSDILEKNGIVVSYIPKISSSEGIVEIFQRIAKKQSKIIIPRSSLADEYLKDTLSKLGYHVYEFYLYQVRIAEIDDQWIEFLSLLRCDNIDFLIFTSPSNVRSFFEILEKISPDLISNVSNIGLVISIGPKTSKELKRYNLYFTEAKIHSLQGIANLINSKSF